MNYQKQYQNLINSRKILVRNKKTGIYEKHHIIPKSLGGTNIKSNFILLTPKEHYIAHLLLTKMYAGKEKAKMCYALMCMCMKNKLSSRNVSSKQYEYARNLLLIHCNGKNHNNYGKKASNETKKKMSISHTGTKNGFYGKLHNEETIKIIKEKRKTQIIKHVKETKEKLSKMRIGIKNPFFGKTHSDEVKRKISLRSQGTCWIHNLELKISKLIKLVELEKYLKEKWIKGRLQQR